MKVFKIGLSGARKYLAEPSAALYVLKKLERREWNYDEDVHGSFEILWWTQRKEKERWQSDAEYINVWNGHYYFIQMPFLCLKNLSFKGSTNDADVKRKPRDRRWFKWEKRAYAKTTCVPAISKQWICGKLGRTLAFLEQCWYVKYREALIMSGWGQAEQWTMLWIL